MSDDNEKMVETPEEEHIKRRCLIVRSNGEMKEELVDLQDQDSLKQLFNYELVYIGEIENSKICILGYVLSNSFLLCVILFQLVEKAKNCQRIILESF